MQNSTQKTKKSKIHFSIVKNVGDFWLKFWDLSGAKVCRSCRSRQELSNEVLHATIGFDTAENEPLKVWRWFISFFNSLDCDCSVELSGMSTEVVGIRSEVMHQLTGGNYLLDFLVWTWQERREGCSCRRPREGAKSAWRVAASLWGRVTQLLGNLPSSSASGREFFIG